MRRDSRKYILDHEFYCCKCGTKNFTIVRLTGREREKGHLKKVWCANCDKQVNHAECVPYSKYDYQDFLMEYLGNNFTEDGERKMPYGLFKNSMVKEKKWDELENKVEQYMNGGDEDE